MTRQPTLTLAPVKLHGDIPQFKADDVEETYELFFEFIKRVNFKSEVLVLFQQWHDVDYREEHNSILVTHLDEDAVKYFHEYNEGIIGDNRYQFDFAVFSFTSYKEAFKFCIDIRESF